MTRATRSGQRNRSSPGNEPRSRTRPGRPPARTRRPMTPDRPSGRRRRRRGTPEVLRRRPENRFACVNKFVRKNCLQIIVNKGDNYEKMRIKLTLQVSRPASPPAQRFPWWRLKVAPKRVCLRAVWHWWWDRTGSSTSFRILWNLPSPPKASLPQPVD